MLTTIAYAGGLFAILAFVHFFADWIFQSHFEAMNKHKNFIVRGRHCAIYTSAFIPILFLLGIQGLSLLLCLFVLFVSHFIIDTYVPTFLWAKWIRKIPELQKESIPAEAKEEEIFVTLWNKPINAILFIVVDQIFHLSFLWAVVFVALL